MPDVILLFGRIPLATVALTGLAGALLAYWLIGRRPADPAAREGARDLLINLLVGGFIGAKLIYLPSYLSNPGTLILFPYGPLALPAGLAGAAVAAAWTLWRRADRQAVLDTMAAPAALGLAVALIGWQAPGAWAFAPLVGLAGLGALRTGAAGTAVLVAGALTLADQVRPATGAISTLQVGAALAGTAAWLWLQRQTKKDSGT